ncbi:MAG: spore maturation protein [Oscillospiraceae bacterium]|jgi:spore maturation protein B|nr:spore maturation protein [Oscillospiraceae bacterium]
MHDLLIPGLLLGMLVIGVVRRVPVYDTFLEGAKDGLQTALRILPCLAAMLAAVALLTASGAMEALLAALSPILRALGIPEGTLPLLLMRPFSGSASLAVLEQTLAAYGADSPVGRAASTMMGSSETIFYTASLYLGAAGVRRARHAIPAALLAWLAGGLAAAWACQWL